MYLILCKSSVTREINLKLESQQSIINFKLKASTKYVTLRYFVITTNIINLIYNLLIDLRVKLINLR